MMLLRSLPMVQYIPEDHPLRSLTGLYWLSLVAYLAGLARGMAGNRL
ncbi:MAG: hypothetical protein R3C68_14160 [Myxococcota bacterium]